MIYEKNGVQVDSARYVVNGETFPINSIASVRAYEVATGSIKNMIIGIIVAIVGLGMLGSSAVVGLIMIAIGAAMAYFNKPGKVYSVRTSTSAGEADSYTSSENNEVMDIVNAINEAIIKRG